MVGRPPGRLAGLLAALDAAGTTHVELLVCAAALSDRGEVLASELRARASTGASPGDVQVVDLAWLSSWRARVGLWGWRREPVRRAMAQRLARLADGGLGRLQQWVCLAPAPCVVTLGRLRADACDRPEVSSGAHAGGG